MKPAAIEPGAGARKRALQACAPPSPAPWGWPRAGAACPQPAA
eukprot:CAMPEP_0172817912 /NCGR_PEP_ID=MMETSP1075-20121228/13557_1 /TAXON_ID=2916 /ORGANISM="Ceratium fusus, Strain PA161109" /LENGTH=42 /DNA_ID= /DNA_START= /DNA_END= /DNA_ORIENTATION=